MPRLNQDVLETQPCRYGVMTYFKADNTISRSLREYGEWAQAELDFLLYFVGSRDTVIDVGAFIGTHTLAFAQKLNRGGEVYAFEPQPAYFEVLKANIAQNGLHHVKAFGAAVSDQVGRARVAVADLNEVANLGNAPILPSVPPSAESFLVETIEVATIDQLALKKCDLIKVDVENMELNVLKGAQQTLRATRPVVFAECNSLQHGWPVVEFSRQLGYHTYLLNVPAYNPDNFRRSTENCMGDGRETGLVLVPAQQLAAMREHFDPARYPFLAPISCMDDLALALLKKPQYKHEVLSQGTVAKVFGVDFWANEPELRQFQATLQHQVEGLAEQARAVAQLSVEKDELARNHEKAASALKESEDEKRRLGRALDYVANALAGKAEEAARLSADMEQAARALARQIEEASRLRAEKESLEADNQRAIQEVHKKNELLSRIYESHGWKALSTYYRVRDKLLPLDSRRRNVTRSLWTLPHRTLSGLLAVAVLLRDMRIVRKSGLFDPDWYLRQNPDVARAGVNPLKHYVRHGAFERRDPNPNFDSDWYLSQNPDVARAGMNPLVHYLRWGAAEGRNPSPFFDSNLYLQQNPEVRVGGLNPLVHYLGLSDAKRSESGAQGRSGKCGMRRVRESGTYSNVRVADIPRRSGDYVGCTIICKNDLSKARVLAHSWKEHNPEAPFFVLITDLVEGYFDHRNEEFLTVEAASLPISDQRNFFFKYTLLEASTAVKPYFLEYLFTQHDFNKLIYLDSDILVTGNFGPLCQILREHSIVLIPHLTSPFSDDKHPSEITILQSGTFNLGFIALRKSDTSLRMLKWWQERLYAQCLMAPERGMHVDQKWMDLVPGCFGDTYVLRESGYNVAYWNLHDRTVEIHDGRITVNGQPAYFFHFSGIDPNNLDIVSKHQNRWVLKHCGDLKIMFERYARLVLAAGWHESKAWPYTYDQFDNGARIPALARRLYWSLGASAAQFGNPLNTDRVDSFWAWLNQPIDGIEDPALRISRIWHEVYRNRADLRSSFPDLLGTHRAGFLEWIRNSAPVECDLDPFFYPEPARAHVVPAAREAESFGVNVLGYAQSEKGMGEAVRSDIRILQAAGVPHVVINFSDQYGSQNVERSPKSFSDRNPHAINLLHVNADQVDLLVERQAALFHNRYNIGFWTWELARFPSLWESAFRHFDEIWVPSNFVRDAVAELSPIPVVTVPHSINPEMPVAEGFKMEHLGVPAGAFVFLFMFDFYSLMARKNPTGLVRAFKMAFGGQPDVWLLIKCSHSSFDPAAFQELEEICRGGPIKLYESILPREVNNALIAACDSYISLHRSEGFGLTMAEAMCLGKPVIATAYSGNLDFMHEGNSFLVRHRLVEIQEDAGPYKAGCVWAEPDIDHAAELMRFVYENRRVAPAIGDAGRNDVLRQLHPKVIGDKVRRHLLGLRFSVEKVQTPSPITACNVSTWQSTNESGSSPLSDSPRGSSDSSAPPSLGRYLSCLEENWDEFGRTDPFYWILTTPEKKGNKWEVSEFFESGQREIEGLISRIAGLGVLLGRERALDFGCGAGRLTQALAAYFEVCYGVDIAPSMIDLANAHNHFGTKCRYSVNRDSDLRQFPDGFFDLVYSNIVLQHIHPLYAKEYIKEFVRVLRPGGLAVFQLPSALANSSEKYDPGTPAASTGERQAVKIEMHGIPFDQVIQLVVKSGAKIVHIEDDHLAGPEWFSFRYFVSKAST